MFDGRHWLRDRPERDRPTSCRRNQPHRPALDAEHPRHGPQPAHASSSSPPATRRWSTSPNVDSVPTGDGLFVRASARCGAATPTRRRSTRRARTSASASARAPTTRTDLAALPHAHRPGRSGSRSPGVARLRVTFPRARQQGSRCAPARRRVADGRNADERRRAERPGAARGRTRQAAQARRRRTPERLRPARGRLPRRPASATPRRRRSRPRRSTASCSTPSAATASSSPARWRCCCGWAACPRAWPPASRPARSTPRPASTSCATSTPTRGSRSGSRATAGSRSTRRRPPRPPRAQPADARNGPSGGPGRRPELGGGDRRGAAGRRRAGRGRRRAVVADRAARRSPARRGRRAARARRPAPPARRRAAGRCRSSSARCAAPRRDAGAGHDAARARARFAAHAGGRRLRPRAARAALRRPRRAPTRAQRRGAARASSAAAAGSLGRLRAWWALPPRRAVSRAPTTARRWTTSYDLFQRGMALLEDGDFNAATVPLAKAARPRARQDLDPRGARPRLLPLAPLRGGARGVRGGRRARADQRLRAVLPRPLADELGRAAEARKPLALAACCGPTGATTGSTATRAREGRLDAPRGANAVDPTQLSRPRAVRFGKRARARFFH